MRFRLVVIGVFLLAVFLRFWQLGSVPPGLTNDEASYIYSAYSIWHTGRDIQGKFLPFSFQLDNSFSPVPVYVIAPFVGLFGIGPVTGRLPFALAGVGVVLLSYLLAWELFKRKDVALFSMAVAAVSPWGVFVSRIAYDAGLALFFALLGTYIFIRGRTNGRYAWALVPFFLSFYSYHATKLFLLAFIPFLFIVFRKEVVKHRAAVWLSVAGFLFIILSFFYVSQTQSVNRQLIFLWNHADVAANVVKGERRLSNGPFVLRQIFINKLMYWGRIARENYLEAISPQFLFLYGETGGLAPLYGVLNRGVMYILDLPFLLLGIWQIIAWRKNSAAAWVIFGGLLLAPIPAAFTVDRSYGMRALMLLPFLAVITGVGLASFFTMARKRFWQIAAVGVVLWYVFLVASFCYQYFFRFPIYSAEAWFASSKDLIGYIRDETGNSPVYLVNSGDLLIQFAVWDRMDPLVVRRVYNEAPPKHFGRITFLDGCVDTKQKHFLLTGAFPEGSVYIVPDKCHPETPPAFTIADRGELLRTIWKVFR